MRLLPTVPATPARLLGPSDHCLWDDLTRELRELNPATEPPIGLQIGASQQPSQPRHGSSSKARGTRRRFLGERSAHGHPWPPAAASTHCNNAVRARTDYFLANNGSHVESETSRPRAFIPETDLTETYRAPLFSYNSKQTRRLQNSLRAQRTTS